MYEKIFRRDIFITEYFAGSVIRKAGKMVLVGCCALLVVACSDANNLTQAERNATPQALLDEQAFLNSYNATPVNLTGLVQDETGTPVAAASIRIMDSSTSVITDSNGVFNLASLSRINRLIEVSASGYRNEYIPVYLQHPVTVNSVTLPTVVLSADLSTRARMLFGGDVAFGRRFLDVDESTPLTQIPPDDPEALIQASDPESGTREVLSQLRPYYQEADLGVFNFETPVTDTPLTPHPEKDFVFYTLSASLPAISWLGVDFVSMGNNHVYDYLESGLIDTMNHLNAAGIPFAGAGLTSADAFRAYRTQLKGSDYGFLGMTSIGGFQHSINYVASDTKGGAADLTRDADVVAAIQGEQGSAYIPVVQYHTGDEYIFEPTDYVLSRIQIAADENVPLAILHHPHVAQGVGRFNNSWALLGLGNLAFDQARLETMLGVMAQVDMTASHVDQIRLLPVYLENYAPKLISGRLAHDFLRRLGEFSHAYNGLLYPFNGQGWVSMTASDSSAVDRIQTINVSIPSSGTAIVDLRQYQQWGESLHSVTSSTSIDLQMGRDLMQHGDFEDWDRDAESNEARRWNYSGTSSFICQSQAYRDNAALCMVRKWVNFGSTEVAFRNRIRVMGDAHDTPNKDLSLFGYYKADNAGPLSIVSRYYASSGDLEFGEELALQNAGGSFGWQAFSYGLNMPADVFGNGEQDARALRVFIRQSPPATGEGLAVFDELAIIAWENNISSGQLLAVPHAKDFLKVTGNPGTLSLDITLRKYVPVASQ